MRRDLRRTWDRCVGALLLAGGVGCSSDQVSLTGSDLPIAYTSASISIANPQPVTVPRNTTHVTDFTISNSGTAPGTVSLVCTGKFVTCNSIEVTSLTLGAGQSAVIGVTWTAGPGAAPNALLTLKATNWNTQGVQNITIQ